MTCAYCRFGRVVATRDEHGRITDWRAARGDEPYDATEPCPDCGGTTIIPSFDPALPAPEPRPRSVAAILREAADEIPIGRHAVEFMADVLRVPRPNLGTQLEADLRMLAAWFDMHPDIAAYAHAVLDAIERTT